MNKLVDKILSDCLEARNSIKITTRNFTVLIITIMLLASCSAKKANNTKAFYYWKTRYKLSEHDKELIKKLKFDKCKIIPVGKLRFNNTEKYPYKYVPCVFITNEVIKKLSQEELNLLAIRINKEVEYIADKISLKKENKDSLTVSLYDELQIDCDWSVSTKDKYFFFLKKIRKNAINKKISVTLRLWQLKNKKLAGIPPVEKAMLMCYSSGNPKDYDIENSLANYNEIKKYIKGQSYPIELDIALPIYSWAILFRNRQFKTIVRNFNFKDAQSDTSLFKQIGKNRYFVKKDTVMFDYYVRYGDELRLENFNKNEMSKLIKLLKSEDLKLNNSVISFFSWDSTYIENHGYKNINEYYDNFVAP